MDLRGNQITVGEILSNPRARQLALREFPILRMPGAQRKVWYMPLERIIAMGRGRISPVQIEKLLQRLRAL